MLEKVRQTIEKYGMLERGDRVVIGISGGPDSVALLYLLYSLRKEYDLALHIAHLEHGIRGEESKEDAQFVKELAKRLDLAITEGEMDVPSLAKNERLSLEEAARNARHQFFLDVAYKMRAKRIATGHTADDQVETVLMRLVRGSGMEGLGGMLPVRELEGGMRMIRPLIEIWRQDIESYLKENGLEFREDSSNRDLSFLRNKVRLGLIPYLTKDYNPKLKDVLMRLSEGLRDDYDYLRGEVEKAFLDLTLDRGQRPKAGPQKVSLETKRLCLYPMAIQRGILRRAIEEVKGDLRKISYQNWRDLDGLIGRSNGTSSLDLAGGVKVKRIYGKLLFYKRGSDQKPKEFSYRLKVPGLTEVPEAKLKIEAEVVGLRYAKRRSRNEEWFDFDKLKFPITVRNRRPGDRIRPLGMKGTKKVKDLFIDQKIPLDERDAIPLVTSKDGKVIWGMGLRMADPYKVTARTRRILRMKLKGAMEE